MRAPRLVASTLGCALALSLSACGYQQTAVFYRMHDDPALRVHVQGTARAVSDPTVDQLWSSFQSSLASAKTMHISGTVVLDKKTATVDLSGTCDGSNGRSTTTTDNETVEVTAVAGTYYVKANTAYWRAVGMPQATINTIGTRYLATTDASLGASSVGGVVGSLKTIQAVGVGMGVIAEKTTLIGRPVYLFSISTTEGRMTIWVTDTAYTLLRIRLESPDGTEELTFSEWNNPVSYTAPPEAQVIRL